MFDTLRSTLTELDAEPNTSKGAVVESFNCGGCVASIEEVSYKRSLEGGQVRTWS